MRKLLMVGIVGGLLAVPAAASAVVIPGATYSGTFSTGAGGTATLVVSADGSEVSFSGGNFGEPACAGSIATFPLPITDGSFSQLTATIDIQGSFDTPGTASGSARNTTFCESGTRAWTATTEIAWPDALIGRSTDAALLGQDVYNTTAAEQTRAWAAKRGQARRFETTIENDGTSAAAPTVKGCGSSKGFKVTYASGPSNVTGEVTGGNYEPELDPGESDPLALVIKPTRKAKPGKTKSCKLTVEAGEVVDAVKAELTVKRG
jgi:hypothetical protein